MTPFSSFVLNKDGEISLQEASSSNGSIKEFKQVDVDNDGFVYPSEFDLSLV